MQDCLNINGANVLVTYAHLEKNIGNEFEATPLFLMRQGQILEMS